MKDRQILRFYFANLSSFIGSIACSLAFSFNFTYDYTLITDNYSTWEYASNLNNFINGVFLILLPSYLILDNLSYRSKLINSKKELLISLGATEESLKRCWFKSIIISSITIYLAGALVLFNTTNKFINPIWILISLIFLLVIIIRNYNGRILTGVQTIIHLLSLGLFTLYSFYIKGLLNDFWYSDIIESINLDSVTSKLNDAYYLIHQIEKYQLIIIVILAIPFVNYSKKLYKIIQLNKVKKK